jgi:hypothetical protein
METLAELCLVALSDRVQDAISKVGVLKNAELRWSKASFESWLPFGAGYLE